MARKGDRLKISGLVVLIVLGIGGVAGSFLWTTLNDPVPDTDYCPTNQDIPIPAHWAVVMDTTEPYTRTQTNRLHSWFRELLEEIPRYGKVSLYLMNADATAQPAAKVSLCSPAKVPSGALESVNANRAFMYKTWSEGFEKQFIDELDAVDETSSQSPILERLPFVSNDAFAGTNATVADKRLYLVSDLLQHSEEGYSMYRDPEREWLEFQTRPDFATLTASPFMNGVSVNVLHLLRPCSPEQELQGHVNHRLWWDRYFTHLRASVERIENVSGADSSCAGRESNG